MKEMWSETYRPKIIGDYVFKDQKQKDQIEKWISGGALPHILLSGSPGTGKSTLIQVLLNELKIDPFDILTVNASRDNGVDFIREQVTNFSERMGVGNIRYIFLDEADGLSHAAQGVLRGTLEKYASSVRFLLTCNYPHKIMDAIKSRCEIGRMHIEKLDAGEFYTRLIDILEKESIEIDPDALESIVQKTYPDLRRGISMIQKNSISGKLTSPDLDSEVASEYKTDMVVLFKAGRFTDARKLICEKVSKDEYDEIYTFMYQNLEVWSEDDIMQSRLLIAIRDGMINHTMCNDIELNLSATFAQLELISKGLL
jgi:replication factor C small subunit